MKHTNKKFIAVLIIVFNLFISEACFGQLDTDSVEQWIKKVNIESARINSDTGNFTAVQKDVFGLSAEGGFLRSYYHGKTLQKAILTLFGENGQLTTEYYLMNGQIVFSVQTGLRYKGPAYEGNVEIKSQETDRIYLKNKKIIRWYNNDNIIVGQSFYVEKEKEISDEFKNVQ